VTFIRCQGLLIFCTVKGNLKLVQAEFGGRFSPNAIKKKAHRHFTCTTTPKGVFQWTVLVMGLKNARGQFQRMMEWGFQDTPNIDPHIDDVIIGSTGSNMEELVANHLADVTRVLGVMEKIN